MSAFVHHLSRASSSTETLVNSEIDDTLNSSDSEAENTRYRFQNNVENSDDDNDGDDSDDDDGDGDDDVYQWNWKNCNSINERKFPFLGQTGNQKSVTDILHSFLLYFDKEVIGKIVMETNKYAEQTIQSNSILSRTMKNWKPVDEAEIYVLLGIYMLMGIVQKPSIRSYYCKDPFIETPIFSKIMKKERYDLICKFLHFVDNNTKKTFQGPAKLFKIYDFFRTYKRTL